jgi:hypothetical protein
MIFKPTNKNYFFLKSWFKVNSIYITTMSIKPARRMEQAIFREIVKMAYEMEAAEEQEKYFFFCSRASSLHIFLLYGKKIKIKHA